MKPVFMAALKSNSFTRPFRLKDLPPICFHCFLASRHRPNNAKPPDQGHGLVLLFVAPMNAIPRRFPQWGVLPGFTLLVHCLNAADLWANLLAQVRGLEILPKPSAGIARTNRQMEC